jgi:hypothetical protein
MGRELLCTVAEARAKSRPPRSPGRSGLPGQGGQGIATEAVRTFIAWLGQQSVPSVIAHTRPPPPGVSAVAAAAGLTSTGQLQDGEMRWRLIMTP